MEAASFCMAGTHPHHTDNPFAHCCSTAGIIITVTPALFLSYCHGGAPHAGFPSSGHSGRSRRVPVGERGEAGRGEEKLSPDDAVRSRTPYLLLRTPFIPVLIWNQANH